MAYYNQFPATYFNPYQQTYVPPVFQQMPQQQMIQQPVQQPQTVQTSNSIIWVSGEKEAAMYPIAPNNAVTLWSQSEPVVYLKQADASGKPTMKIFDLVERVETAQNEAKTADGKTVVYATKDDLSAVVGAVRGFNETISSIRSEVDAIKGDVYGLAGKKRPVKVKEAEDDG